MDVVFTVVGNPSYNGPLCHTMASRSELTLTLMHDVALVASATLLASRLRISGLESLRCWLGLDYCPPLLPHFCLQLNLAPMGIGLQHCYGLVFVVDTESLISS